MLVPPGGSNLKVSPLFRTQKKGRKALVGPIGIRPHPLRHPHGPKSMFEPDQLDPKKTRRDGDRDLLRPSGAAKGALQDVPRRDITEAHRGDGVA